MQKESWGTERELGNYREKMTIKLRLHNQSAIQ
jgi:hypothetical protein